MRPKEWAEREGLTPATVWSWCRNNTMPVPFTRTATGMFLIHDPKYENTNHSLGPTKIVCYARASSSDQKADLERQADRLKDFAMGMFPDAHIEVVSEIGSGMNDNRKKLGRVLSDSTATHIVVEHRDRLARMNFSLIDKALNAQGRRIIVVDNNEVDDDLVRDVTEVLTSLCARLYGRRSARRRAHKAVDSVVGDHDNN